MAVIDEGKVNKQVDTGETQETPVFKTVVGSDKEYDGTANSEDYGPNPGLTVSEDTEVNSTRFEYRYHSYLDLLSSLFPNALAIHLAAQSGDWSGVKDENKPELSADYLDKLLDLDHFIKDYRNEDWGDDLDDDTKAKIAQLFQTACVFYNEDTIGQSLPDYGDTKISADNGSDQITWGGTKYVMSGMDARYSDMKVATTDPTADESEWQESNPFSVNKISIANLTAMSRMIAEALDLNNDGVVGTDDAVLVLNLYASALNDNSNNWSNYIDLGNNVSTTLDKYQSPYSNCSKNILHIDNLDGVTRDYANDSTLNDSLSEDRFFNFYNYSFDNIITTADSQTYTFNNFFHELNTGGTTVENKLNFLCAVASRNTSFNLEDDNNNQIPLSTTITVGNTTKTLAEVFYSIASEWNSVFSKMANRSLKSSELATAMLSIIFKYGDPDKGYASVMELASHLEGLYESSITDLYTFDNWQDYYKTAAYDGDNTVDTKGWNESVNDLYNFMKEYFENNGLDPTKFQTPQAWLQALKEANAKGTAAGHYLDPTPLVNLFNEIYKEERSDEIKMNVHHMDYTNEGEELGSGAGITSDGQTYNYGELIAYVVNLLMPQYRRRVEVEDLNKNFWVISQVLSILLNQVFGDDGLEAILKGHMAEIMELWNNVKYLWNVIDAQGKMINDLALALKASKQPDVPETEFYRDVYQYKSDSVVNTAIKDTQFNWTGAMWDFNGDGYINGYEPETILKTSGLYENNDKIRFIGTDGQTYTISPASIEGFKNLYKLEYTNSGSTRNISFNWVFNMSTKAYWVNADTGLSEIVNYTIDGPDPSQHPRFNPLEQNNTLFSGGNLQNSIGRLYSVDGDEWISDTQTTGGSYKLNVDYSSASTTNNLLGDIMSGVCRLCFVNVDSLYGKNEQDQWGNSMNTFVQPSIANESGVRQVFEFTEYERLRPIIHGGATSFWLDWDSDNWKNAYNLNKEQVYTTFLNALVFQDYSGTREGFWSYFSGTTDTTNKMFKNKFLCSLNFNSNGTANGLYMLCAIAPSSIIYTKGDKSKIVLKDLGGDTYANYSYQSSESNTNRFYGLYPVCIDNYLIEGLENDIVENTTVNVNNEHNHQLVNCVYRSITADDNGYSKGISIRRQVALNILKKMTILASLESTEGYMKTLNPEDATALENIVKNNSVTSPIGRGLPVENMFEASMAGSVILSETEIKINGKNGSIILAGLVDEEQSTLSEVVAINQHFKIKERPLRIWSKDGTTIDRVEHISPTFSRDSDEVSFEVNYTNYPTYSSEKLLDSYEDNDVSIWGGMSSSLNTWFPQYAVGQNFIPNQYSDSLNFVCEASIAEKLYQLNTYHDAESTTDSDDSYYVSFNFDNNTYTTSNPPTLSDNFTITYPTPEYGIKVKG